jgi:mRNA interferase MazF
MITRYGIYWVNLDPTVGREVQKSRPCVIVSPHEMSITGIVVVCPLTTTLHPTWSHRIQITCRKKKAEIMPDQIRAVSTERLGKHIDTLSDQDAEALRDILSRLYAS